VDLWGTWCPPCRTAIPELVDLHRRYKHHGLEIVGLNYEQGDPAAHAALVREFAGKHGIAYELALGTPEIRKQVPGFSGYPTLLFFRKGLEFDHLEVGFTAGHGKQIEDWVRGALGLDAEAGDATAAPGEEDGGKQAARATPPPPKVADQLAPGVINAPGDGDRGFDFELEDPDGKELRFADFRGKVVVVALVLAGDTASTELASGLAELQAKYAGAGLAAVGVCFGRSSDPGEHAAGARALAGSAFPIGLAKLDFIKKVHQARGIPVVLLFDREGVLQLRETGSSPQKRQALEKRVREVLGLDV
jgi:thiol-disulfide isomerase/thioredoxin